MGQGTGKSTDRGYAVRKGTLLVGLMLGAAVGLLASLTDGIGLKIVMMAIGALGGMAVGGALSRIGKKDAGPLLRSDSILALRFSLDDQLRTYWRDKGQIYPMPGHPDPEGVRRDLDVMT